MRPSYLLATLLTLLLPCTSAARTRATSFCKCVCSSTGNSTIIALNPPSSSSSTSPSPTPNLLPRSSDPQSPDIPTRDEKTHHLTCADCNRAFCLAANLLICKDTKEEDVFATCFQRDSLKDELVVLVFLMATISLLGWALVKPWVEQFRGSRYSAVPVPGLMERGSVMGLQAGQGERGRSGQRGQDLARLRDGRDET